MDVDAVRKGLLEGRNIRDMGEDAQLDLGIVERDERLALIGHERLTDAAAFLGADRDVLQVRVRRGQAPGVGARDRIGGVHAARLRVDVLLKRVGVGGLQLRQLAPIKHAAGQIMLRREVLKNIGPGRVLARLPFLAARQAHFVKEDVTQLRGRTHVELFARKLMDLIFKRRHLLAERVGHAAQRVAVHLDAVHLHFGEHRHEGAFERLVDRRHLGAVELRLELLPEPQSNIGIFGGVFRGLIDRHLIKGDHRFAGAQKRFDRDRLVAQVAFRQRVHAVVVVPGIERVAHQHRVIDRVHSDTQTRKDLGVVLHVLTDLQDRRILEHGLQQRERVIKGHLPLGKLVPTKEVIPTLLVRQRHIARLTRLYAQAHAHKIGAHLIEARRLRIDGHVAPAISLGHPRLESRGIAHDLVFLGINSRELRRRCVFLRRLSDDGRLDAHRLRHTARQGAEFHRREECEQRLRLRVLHLKRLEAVIKLHLAIELHELLRQLDLRAVVDQRLAALGLFDLFRAVQQLLEGAVFVDQQRCRLDPDPRRARHVIDTVTGKRLNIDHALRPHAEFLFHAFDTDALVLHGIEHLNPAAHKLHEVFV